MATEIPLSRGMVTLVDDSDAEWLSGYRWFVNAARGGRFYAITKGGLLMHRLILQPPEGFHCDHIDNDGLNNQRGNLRLVDRCQNAWNARGKKRLNTLPKGVHPNGRRYKALIMARGKSYRLGSFDTPEEAAAAYVAAARELHGDFARTA